MKIRYFVAIVFLVLGLSTNIFAQAPQTEWIQIIGRPGINEYGAGADSTPDGGYAAGGTATWEGGTSDCLIVKFNSNGDSVWTRTIGVWDNREFTNSFIVLPDGRYVSAGSVGRPKENPILMNCDALLMIADADGTHNSTGYYGENDRGEIFYSVAQSFDSNIVCAGYVGNDSTSSDIYLYKNDYGSVTGLGGSLWNYTYIKPLPQIPNSIIATLDGGGIIVGRDQNNTTFRTQGFISKLSPSGGILTMDFTNSDGIVEFYDVVQLPDNSYIITGLITYDSYNSNYDLILIKRDSTLAEIWTKTFGNEDTDEGGISIDVTPDGGFIVGGSRQPDKHSNTDFWALRFDANGDTLWTKTVGTEKQDILHSIAATDDGGYIMCGNTMEEHANWKYDMLVIKLVSEVVGIKDNRSLHSPSAILFPNYPNPFYSQTEIKYQLDFPGFVELTVYNTFGIKLHTLVNHIQPAGEYSVLFDGSGFASGIYYYQLSTNNFKQTKKMILFR